MSEIEVLEVVINQIGELRVPMKETELRDGLEVILLNLTALKDAVEQAQNAQESDEAQNAKESDDGEEEVTERV